MQRCIYCILQYVTCLMINKSFKHQIKQRQYDFMQEQQPSKLTNPTKFLNFRYKLKKSLNSKTIDPINLTEGKMDSKLLFQNVDKKVGKNLPGPGQYNIDQPIVKPIYETIEKKDNVILVKLNHIGGTANFKSEIERFQDNASLNIQKNVIPGPGSYDPPLNIQNPKKQSFKIRGNYEIIQQVFRHERQTMQSMPHYEIHSGYEESQYNGIPQKMQLLRKSFKKGMQKQRDQKEKASEKYAQLVELNKSMKQISIINSPKRRKHQKQLVEYVEKPANSINMNSMTQTMTQMIEKSKRQQQQSLKLKHLQQKIPKISFSQRKSTKRSKILSESMGYNDECAFNMQLSERYNTKLGVQQKSVLRQKEKPLSTVYKPRAQKNRLQQEQERKMTYNQGLLNVMLLKEYQRERSYRTIQ